METLATAFASLKDAMTEEEMRQLKKRLYLIYQLSSLQLNLTYEIEWALKGRDKYRYTIKNFHKKIQALIRNNTNVGFWKGMTQEQLDTLADDADELEKLVYGWAGLKQDFKETNNNETEGN